MVVGHQPDDTAACLLKLVLRLCNRGAIYETIAQREIINIALFHFAVINRHNTLYHVASQVVFKNPFSFVSYYSNTYRLPVSCTLFSPYFTVFNGTAFYGLHVSNIKKAKVLNPNCTQNYCYC